MARIEHKDWGIGEIITREGNRMTVRFNKVGKEMKMNIPKSFVLGIFEIDDELQKEVDDALEAERETARKEREEKEALRQQKQAEMAPKNSRSTTKRTGKIYTKVTLTGDMEKDFESFMRINGYSKKSLNGDKSTIYSYITSVKSIMRDEGLDWNELYQQISSIVPMYDIGGKKEDIGSKSNHTIINALRRFENFANNSVSSATENNNN